MTDVLEQLERLRRDAETSLQGAGSTEAIQRWQTEFLGRKGQLTLTLRDVSGLPPSERPVVGKAANEVKKALEQALEARQSIVRQIEVEAALANSRADVTLPGRPQVIGKAHPSSATLQEIYAIFGQMGFQVYDSPDVETDEYNFGLLNMPPGHPARDMWDTFYTTTPGLILRTHTSPGQIHAMRQYAPEPIRIILPGKCYRYEEVTARSESMFHQVEGLAVGVNITFSDLKGTLFSFANQMFGPGRRLRFRKSYFPFTEPSVEVDVDCMLCGSQGCALCKYSGWLEILGAGMVHPRVLQNGGYDPNVYSGFAFGMGPERIAILKHGINDIRYFFSNDVRFLGRVG
jgi:phenylalanyl-tRNA synthetase alpha chain